MWYRIARAILFQFEPESAHSLSLRSLKWLARRHLLPDLSRSLPAAPKEIWGMTFPNPIGLAAGLDKNGDYLDAMAAMGFGFIEVGTITPQPQAGNEKPRLFRLPEQQALINRLGFNNKGVDYLIKQIQKSRYRGILGINIGKNKTTPNARALEDYLFCLRKVYAYANYVTLNVSSPNTPGLRKLQDSEHLHRLLAPLKEEQQKLADQHGRYVPIAVKVSPDLVDDDIQSISDVLIKTGIDGLVATNTTLSRDTLEDHPDAKQIGGLSGAPLLTRSTEVLRKFRAALGPEVTIIGVGGIQSAQDVVEKQQAGADLVQVYSGFIYHGPALIKQCVKKIAD